MSVSSNIPLLTSDHHTEGIPALETVADSPFEEQEGSKMATPMGEGEGVRPQELPLASQANGEEEKRGAHPSLQSQQSTISQAANVKRKSTKRCRMCPLHLIVYKFVVLPPSQA